MTSNNLKSKETLDNEKVIRDARAAKWEPINLSMGTGKIMVFPLHIQPERMMNGVALIKPGSRDSDFTTYPGQGIIVSENERLQQEFPHKAGDHIYFKRQPESAKVSHKGKTYVFLYQGDIICKVE